MFARAQTGTIIGVDAHSVVVETNDGKGLPQTRLIGLARGAARESVVRVKSAFKTCDIPLPAKERVINLLPAELPKDASSLDLALAASLLASIGHIPAESLAGRRFFGELTLCGALEPVRGAVLIADLARRGGERELIVPAQNAAEAAVIPEVRVVGARDLGEVIEHLRGTRQLAPALAHGADRPLSVGCFSEVCGQTAAKRALEIAAAGGHNVLMIGPPGSGKTMLARRLPGILPELSAEESIEVTRIQSAAGMLTGRPGLVSTRPFRAPHHSASDVAICGGGSIPRPGEVTLAHRGVLFLDELPEFNRRALESLREPLEEGLIHVARASLSLCFPAEVLLIAAMNPCPCGNFRDDSSAAAGHQVCLCSFDQIQRYRARVSGPLLDRIDLHVSVPAVPYRDFVAHTSAEPSIAIRERVVAARTRQQKRLGAGRTNAMMCESELRRDVTLEAGGQSLIERAIDTCGLSTRGINRVLKMSRTLADLAGATLVEHSHVREALVYRNLAHKPAGMPWS